MTHKEAVRTVYPNAMCEKGDNGVWIVRKHAEGKIIGSGADGMQAWYAARLMLQVKFPSVRCGTTRKEFHD